jgi:hypothetical protein
LSAQDALSRNAPAFLLQVTQAAYASVAGVSTITNGLNWNMYGATVGIITASGFVATGATGVQGIWGGQDPIGY